MIVRKRKFTIPEYREKKEIYQMFGFKEKYYKEKGLYCYVIFSIDESDKNYTQLCELEKDIYRKGPHFYPIILFVAIAFLMLSGFVIALAISWKDGTPFAINEYSFGFLLPAFAFLVACVIYTYYYFSTNKKIMEKGRPSKEELIKLIDDIKEKK